MTPEQEKELDRIACFLTVPGNLVEGYATLLAWINKHIQQAEDAAFDAGRETYWNEDHPHDETPAESQERDSYECNCYDTVNDWRKSREEEK